MGAIDVSGSGNHTGTFTAGVTVDVGDIISTTTTRKTASSFDITSEFSENVASTAPVSPLIVTNTNDSGTGSLRAAIEFANANPAEDNITFNILGGGVQTIALASNLPALSDAGISIDGASQPGASCGASVDSNGVLLDRNLLIEIDAAGAATHGMTVSISNVSIRGLSIGGSPGRGLFSTGLNLSVTCSHFGVAADGITDFGNAGQGIYISGAGSALGDGTYTGRNIVAGNDGSAQAYFGSDNASMRGNYFGVDLTGASQTAGTGFAVQLFNATATTVGGPSAAERNLFSGNGSSGLYINNEASGTVVQGNYSGLAADGKTALGGGKLTVLNTAVG